MQVRVRDVTNEGSSVQPVGSPETFETRWEPWVRTGWRLSPGQATTRDSCAVYRWYDEDGVLLYVGVTVDLASRAEKHRASIFWPFATTMRAETYSSVAEARSAEGHAVRSENPVFNRALVPAAEREARFTRAVAYLTARPDIQLGVAAANWGLRQRAYPPELWEELFGSTA